MNSRKSVVSLLAISLAATSGQAAFADGGSAFVGGLVGSMLGTAITNQQQQRRVVTQKTYVRRAPAVNTYQRELNREVQTALNHFGFNAGVADGVLGRNSRAAIGQYQAFLGYPATGALTEYERTFLTSSYQRSLIGGPQNAQMMQAQGQGMRGLLLAYRQEQFGGPTVATAPAPSTVPVAAAPATIEVVTPAPDAAPEADVVDAAGVASMPSFMPAPSASSMASHCNRVNMSANNAGGYVTLASLADPSQALEEQFCLARTYAIDQGEGLASSVQGFTPDEIREQCEAFAPVMREYLTRAASQSPDDLRAGLHDFVVSTGANPAQMSGNARICLGVGYTTDNAELAAGSAMVLVGLGEDAYGELLGHQLRAGFGMAKRSDRGVEWLADAANALAEGASPLVTAAGPERVALLEAAIAGLGGASAPALHDAAAVSTAGGGFVLPTLGAATE